MTEPASQKFKKGISVHLDGSGNLLMSCGVQGGKLEMAESDSEDNSVGIARDQAMALSHRITKLVGGDAERVLRQMNTAVESLAALRIPETGRRRKAGESKD